MDEDDPNLNHAPGHPRRLAVASDVLLQSLTGEIYIRQKSNGRKCPRREISPQKSFPRRGKTVCTVHWQGDISGCRRQQRRDYVGARAGNVLMARKFSDTFSLTSAMQGIPFHHRSVKFTYNFQTVTKKLSQRDRATPKRRRRQHLSSARKAPNAIATVALGQATIIGVIYRYQLSD